MFNVVLGIRNFMDLNCWSTRSGFRGQKLPSKIGKSEEMYYFEVLDVSSEDWMLFLKLELFMDTLG